MTNYNKLNIDFIRYLAPTLCGLKPSNLFTMAESLCSKKAIKTWELTLQKQNLFLKTFKISESRRMIIVYDFTWIRLLLSDALVQAYLQGKGYSNPCDTVRTLEELFLRLKRQTNFPHEVGIFLGYPIEDVLGFEENQGHNCKYCGYWKSYCNPEEAKKCCAQYKQCSQMCKQWFEEGFTIPQIIQRFKTCYA